ncbi:hypothetical protein ElyMa_004646000 [Elysia marginata]|uniref:Secreted protein n=1 Tax=Elysia marginata TaxID=1093978 RepID=A0AAV4I4V5_9GAST|nr:hypothetical protein ElyMa_004646000 [Elysia marginata]
MLASLPALFVLRHFDEVLNMTAAKWTSHSKSLLLCVCVYVFCSSLRIVKTSSIRGENYPVDAIDSLPCPHILTNHDHTGCYLLAAVLHGISLEPLYSKFRPVTLF